MCGTGFIHDKNEYYGNKFVQHYTERNKIKQHKTVNAVKRKEGRKANKNIIVINIKITIIK